MADTWQSKCDCMSQHQHHVRFHIQLFSCVPAVQHVLQPGRGEGRNWQAVPRWPPRWHFLLLHPGGVLLQLHDSRQHSSCTLHRGNVYPSCMQCWCVKTNAQCGGSSTLLGCLAAYFTHTLTRRLSTLTMSQSESVCAYVKILVSHLLPVVATDVRWQNRGVIAASIDFTYKGERRRRLLATYAHIRALSVISNGIMEKTWVLSAPVAPRISSSWEAKVTGVLMGPEGGSFPSADLLSAEEHLRASHWWSYLTNRVN